MKYLVLDGNSILNRAFYGIKMLSNKKGQMTNAIYGFLSTFQKLKAELCPDAVAVAFDLPKPTFRHKMFDGYKANRKGMPEELATQLPILKELLTALGYKIVTLEGYEADDILGTFAKYCENKNYKCFIATGDRDSLQLISKNVSVRIAKTKFGKPEAVFYDAEKVLEEYGVTPEKLIDIKALQGDASDNIPGVRGIGEKTAKDLVQKFGGINEIYENLENLDIKSGTKEKLLSGKESAFMSYKLGKINKDSPLKIDDKDFIPNEPDVKSAKKILTDLEFFSFMDKLGLENAKNNEIIANLTEIKDKSEAEKLLAKLNSAPYFAVSMDTEGRTVKEIIISENDDVYVLKNQDLNGTLEKILKIPQKKIVYDFKNLMKKASEIGISLDKNVFDVMLAAYLLSPSDKEYIVKRIAEEYSVSVPNFNILSAETEEKLEETFLLNKLFEPIKNELEKRNQTELLEKIEQPLAEVLADMEITGFWADKNGIEAYGSDLAKELSEIQEKIYDLAGMEFNINSPKQLGNVLFEKLNLPKGKKGKTGYSTSAATLEKLKGMHEIVDLILEFRALSKLKSTYCDGMSGLITSENRIHSSFNQTETRTGRISSTEPNLQNIPVRTERGRQLRKYFGAKEGCMLIDADYSQIELRVMAHISNDKNMVDAFKNGKDIHAITASQIMGVPLNMVTPEMRFRSKAVNFGILYGMGAFSLAQDLKISRFEAQNYINRYLAHYSGVDNYMQNAIKSAKEKGYAETIFHRRRYLPELESTNHNLRAFGERVARNMPIQGSAADIIKIAMINVFNALKKQNLKSKLILQVHDELIIEAPTEEAEAVKELLKTEMENAVKMNVPLKVHIASGKTWFDAKD